MLTRLVVPTPPLEATLVEGLRSGAYAGEPIGFNSTRQALDTIGQAAAWECTVVAALHTVVKPLLADAPVSLKEFMRHAMATAAACKVVAECNGVPHHDMYLAGLFHNVGVPILAHAFPADYSQIVSTLMGSNLELQSEEERVLSFDHQEVGSLFLMTVPLPDSTWQAAAQHHQPGFQIEPATAAVRVCSSLAHQVGCSLGLANAAPQISSGDIAAIGVTDEALPRLLNTVATAANLADRI